VPAAILADTFTRVSLIGGKLVFMNPFFGTAVTLFLLLNPPAAVSEKATAAVRGDAQTA